MQKMKLLYCKSCKSVFNLWYHEKKCECGETSGKYLDELNAIYSGEFSVPIGFDNTIFHTAMFLQPESGMVKRFDAFVIAKECPTFIKE